MIQNQQHVSSAAEKTSLFVLSLTDDGDAARLGHLHHFVHQVLGSLCKVFPLKDTDRTVPHDLLGPAHRLGVGFGALRSTVQTLQRKSPLRFSLRTKKERRQSICSPVGFSPSSRRGCLRRRLRCRWRLSRQTYRP